jgi:putative GTP pyrophosphokinase
LYENTAPTLQDFYVKFSKSTARKANMEIDNLIEQKKQDFVRASVMSDEFIEFVKKNKEPYDKLISYYRCAMMEIETKFKVLNEQFSLEYDRNPIESIKTRIKSTDSLIRKIRDKHIPLTIESIEENICDIAGIRIICSFPQDIYTLAQCLVKQDDITLIKQKDYVKNPKPSGYRSLHLIVSVPIFLQNEKRNVKVEVQLRTIAMDNWASLEHKLRYKKNIPKEQLEQLSIELNECAKLSAQLDYKMQAIHDKMVNEKRKPNKNISTQIQLAPRYLLDKF